MSYKVYMFEGRHVPLLSTQAFIKRVVRHFLIGVTFIALSLFIGMMGYSYFEDMSWIDAYVNASMILSGMGPVSELKTDYGKFFAGSYALFSGIVFLIIIAIIMAPLIHRFLHKFLLRDVK